MLENHEDTSQIVDQQQPIHPFSTPQPVSSSNSAKKFIILFLFVIIGTGAYFGFNFIQSQVVTEDPVGETKSADKSSEATDLPATAEVSKYQSSIMQKITSTNCPTARVRAVDARDNHTYWVQELADGKCWMLTDLAYKGGGMDEYKDVKALTFSNSSVTSNDTVAEYSIPGGANPTVDPGDPSTSTDGGVTNPQFGYRYDWCAAMGVQLNTGACLKNSTTPIPDKNISICPTGWRLPTADEFKALNDAVNGGRTETDEGLRMVWLGQWGSGDRGSASASRFYWSSEHNSSQMSYGMSVKSNQVTVVNAITPQSNANFVRCIAT